MLLTVTAVVVTMTASFAAWDNLTVTKTFNNTTIVQQVDVKTDGTTNLTTSGEAGSFTTGVPTYSGTAQFTVDGDAATLGGKKLTVEPKVTIDSVDATGKTIAVELTGSLANRYHEHMDFKSYNERNE